MNKIPIFGKIKSNPLFSNLLSILGGLLYLIQSWYYAHTQSSVLDEGAYLLKGYLFVNGTYRPFQDYGPWTNHMPLSFLIPGWVQYIFGPGLRTGRYFAIFLGVMMLLGVWLVSRRFGNPWLSAISVWLLALNVPILKVYSVMTSQGLITCMLVWVLFFILGPDRKSWQVYVGMALSALMLLTRINMAPILPLIIFYVYWEHGKKIGTWALVTMLLVVGIGHAFFWPGILKLWAAWLPESIFPYLKTWGKPAGAIPRWDPQIDVWGRLLSLFAGIRIHYVAVMSAVALLMVWTSKENWRAVWRLKIAVFLLVSYVVLFGFHAWASLGNNYCVFCFQNYLMFFLVLGILQINILGTSLREYKLRSRKWLLIVVMAGVTAGIAHSLIETQQLTRMWSGRILTSLVETLMNIPVPRLRSNQIVPGKAPLWGIFANKFGWQEDQIFNSSLLFFFLGLSILLFYFANKVFTFIEEKRRLTRLDPGVRWLVLFMLIGTIFSLRSGFLPGDSDCGWDVIAAYEEAGAHLAEKIPSGSKIFWLGGLSVAPLLYLPDYDLYPPQINNGYSYRLAGDPDELRRYGWWDENLYEQWYQEADIILVEGWRVKDQGDFFDEIVPTPPFLPCKPDTEIHIFVRE